MPVDRFSAHATPEIGHNSSSVFSLGHRSQMKSCKDRDVPEFPGMDPAGL